VLQLHKYYTATIIRRANYGLSYTSFKYNNLNTAKIDEGFKVSIEVENTGKLTGEEVVQLYIRDHFASVTRPIKELKGFEKIALKAGESKTVEFVLTDAHLGFYDNQGEYVVEPGMFDVMVGGNSVDLQKVEIELEE